MHPVIKHILARKNRKIPINDGRKIGLLLYGGVMTGIRGAGAMLAFDDLGLNHAFDEIYVYSAGFPNACYLLSEEARRGASIYYDDLSGKKFINFGRFWKIADTDYMIEVMKNRKYLSVEKILNATTKLYVRLISLKTNKAEYLEVHDVGEKDFFSLMKAATSAPYINPGSVKIKGKRYDDVSFFGNDSIAHLNHILAQDFTDILVIYNHLGQCEMESMETERIFEIRPLTEWQMSRFNTNPEILKKNCLQMGAYVKSLFGVNKPIELEAEKYANINYNGKINIKLRQAVRVSAESPKRR